MKTLKYRSVFGIMTTVALSVFLFTACEKESDEYGTPQKTDRLSKFKRLTFSGSTATTTSNSGSGTFIGNNNNISFSSSMNSTGSFASSSSSSTQFAEPGSGDKMFTDPRANVPAFQVNALFGTGGGDFTVDGENYDLEFGLCATTNFLGFGLSPGFDTSSAEENLKVFIGIDGDFDESFDANDTTATFPINHIVYLFSYGQATQVGSFFDFDGGSLSGKTFGFIVAFNEGSEGNIFWLTEGDVSLSEDGVSISNGMVGYYNPDIMEVDETNTAPFSADFDCISFDMEE